jgi:uncharacterized protein YjbI with pentapeptide repeats
MKFTRRHILIAYENGMRDFSGLNMSDANMSDADMSGADMSGADMSGANMSDADMSRANMSGANMRGADMRGANMSDADMSRANMSDADMSGADMSGANMRGAQGIFAIAYPDNYLAYAWKLNNEWVVKVGCTQCMLADADSHKSVDNRPQVAAWLAYAKIVIGAQ